VNLSIGLSARLPENGHRDGIVANKYSLLYHSQAILSSVKIFNEKFLLFAQKPAHFKIMFFCILTILFIQKEWANAVESNEHAKYWIFKSCFGTFIRNHIRHQLNHKPIQLCEFERNRHFG
jgi:hypothetical protein